MSKKTLDNLQIMKSLERTLSSDFLARIPEINQQNLSEIGQSLYTKPNLRNEFISELFDRVFDSLFMTRALENPLAMFDKGTIEGAKALELVYVDLIKGKDFGERFTDGGTYESDMIAPLRQDNVKVQYIVQNIKMKYKDTISNEQLRSCFNTPNGLSTLVNQIVSRLVDSWNVDKYLMTYRLINKMPSIEIEEGVVKPIDHTTAKEFTRKVKETVKRMTLPSNKYNVGKVTTASKIDDLYIIIDTETSALLDVELLAYAFHMDKVQFQSRIVEIDSFEDESTVCMIVDRDKIHIYDTLTSSGVVANPMGLYENIVLHKWAIMSSCDFANCVKLKTGESKMRKEMPYDFLENSPVLETVESTIEVEEGKVKSKTEKKLK